MRRADAATTGEKKNYEMTYPMLPKNDANMPYGINATRACDLSKNPNAPLTGSVDQKRVSESSIFANIKLIKNRWKQIVMKKKQNGTFFIWSSERRK